MSDGRDSPESARTEMIPVLWLDNDIGFNDPYVDCLSVYGFEVKRVDSVSAAEEEIQRVRYRLLVLDVMVPTQSELEENAYTPDETSRGRKTGLLFWVRNREVLGAQGTQVLVFTVRLDKAIRNEFLAAGLDKQNFATKYELSEPSAFVARICELVGVAATPVATHVG